MHTKISVYFFILDIIWLDSHILQKLLMPSLFFISRSLTIINQGTKFIIKLFKLAFHTMFYSIITKGPQKCPFCKIKNCARLRKTCDYLDLFLKTGDVWLKIWQYMGTSIWEINKDPCQERQKWGVPGRRREVMH